MKSRRFCSLTWLWALFLAPVPGAAQPASHVVDCGAGERLQPVINSARPGDTILVLGSCTENIRFNEETARLTLDGQGSASIHGPNPRSNTLFVAGRNIVIRGLTITGGRNGIAVLRGGIAVIEGNTIRRSAENGINVAQHSYAGITDNTIEFHPDAGIRLLDNSAARIGFMDLADATARGNVIRNNGAAGVEIQRSSAAALAGNTIRENGGPGVLVGGASNSEIAGNHIDENGADGVSVSENSHVQLGHGLGLLNPPNETSLQNLGYGLSCSLNSSAHGELGTLTGTAGDRKFDGSCTLRLPRTPGSR